eukprot:TRINITY_DN4859_c0_g2_i1.p1 TRINITY_DN4859_c0_g2~~TRINITY_DN4859_c0_g2_i1.p1  ORF type:complete len:1866 (+),score=443.62 TRINITY_DN4859_c0_g2_i1:728-5599(+)
MKALAAEMTASFGKRLSPLGISVKELTGDIQLSKQEIIDTQVIVTTPEKWDVITRKTSDVGLTSLVKLLIIDEVHLLNEDRGPVIEAVVARTLRQVEQSQSMIRIVGLSATLPNYKDVSDFLHVDRSKGLFFFNSAYRPVPLEMNFIGINGENYLKVKENMNMVTYQKCRKSIFEGNQVMIFVHSRKGTGATAEALIEIGQLRDENNIVAPSYDVLSTPEYKSILKKVRSSRNVQLKKIFEMGYAIHHAGMLRRDRQLVEEAFSAGFINILVCTATLAWGVNLPAHTVLIKGTEVYNSQRGMFVDIGALDVMQIFGRAGRPQFDTSGEAFILTTYEKVQHYIRLISHQLPIESQIYKRAADLLNGEIVLGTVSNIREAITWLSYTYLHVRMRKNPLVYGCTIDDLELDPHLTGKKRELIVSAANKLDKNKMIRYDRKTGNFYVTALGRIASHYYIEADTIEMLNEKLMSHISDSIIFNVFSLCSEFENVMVREDELSELFELEEEACLLEVRGGHTSREGKVNILLQMFISGERLRSFSLISDMSYVSQNCGRIFRAFFEISLNNGWVELSKKLLNMCKMVDKRIWSHLHPLRQFTNLKPGLLNKLDKARISLDSLRDLNNKELQNILSVGSPGAGAIKRAVAMFPRIDIDVSLQPITRTIIRVSLTIEALFKWQDRWHGSSEPWWIWVEDATTNKIHHSEYFLLQKKQANEPIKLTFIIPILSQNSRYYIHAISDRWLHAMHLIPINLSEITLPESRPPHTKLLSLTPLPISTLNNEKFESLYPFPCFNRVQTQVYHTMYHTDTNAFIGAPTGSGKTIVGELAMLKLFRDTNLKVVYIGPLKALVRERIKDWKKKFGGEFGKKVIELTGDYTPDIRSLQTADIILTTPEKWDGISRNWKQRSYVSKVGLMIIDEIHLLGIDRGPILEVIVSRMRYISNQTDTPIRIVGLSTALANPEDLGDWLGIEPHGLYNFHPSVRPVPITIHITGFQGKHYCPLMASMNKPTYAAIRTHSPNSPVLVFVSSRRQTRLTALDLIASAAADENPQQFLSISDEELNIVLSRVQDPNLQHTLAFGIGLHHAGLKTGDRAIVEELFKKNRIQVLVSTSTLAWGVNLPAHLVVVKGTEYYDPKAKRYVDMPITDVLQMMGRAGRPQYDKFGVAFIMVKQGKKNFYKKFIDQPFPVESSLKGHLPDHINAEIVAGTISTRQDAVDYLTWTYFFRRLEKNPTYYDMEEASFEKITEFLSELVDDTLSDLELSYCIEFDEEEEDKIYPTSMGRIASYYYLKHTTSEIFADNIDESTSIQDLLSVLCDTSEYEDLPVRHNEEKLNEKLAEQIRWDVDNYSFDSPHTKANILLQAHFSHLPLPISDYYSDLKSVLDQSVRIVQAMVDVSADVGWLETTLNCAQIMQMIMQAQWNNTSDLKQLPYATGKLINTFKQYKIYNVSQLLKTSKKKVLKILKEELTNNKVKKFMGVLNMLPIVTMRYDLGNEDIHPYEEMTIKININRRTKAPSNGANTPRFPKRKDESWWLILGDPENGELLALRRVSFSKYKNTKLVIEAPEEPGEYSYVLYLISDVYMGVDVKKTLKLTVVPGEDEGDDIFEGDEDNFDIFEDENDLDIFS